MKVLPKDSKELEFILIAADIARDSPCKNSRCGSVIVKDYEVIGIGYNSSAGEKDWCDTDKDWYDKKVTDKTCCVHAEQRAIMDALMKNPDKIFGSTLYFSRVDNNKPIESGEPYCTICSKMALDAGISEFVLFKKEGITVYNTEEYDDISRNYGK